MNLDAILLGDLIDASFVSDLDEAVRQIQEKAGIKDGGVAALAFSGFDWDGATIRERQDALVRWIKLEESYQ